MKDHVFYRNLKKSVPIIDSGKGILLYDKNGKEYIDGSSGALTTNIGHCVKEVIDAINEQISKISFVHGTQFKNKAAIELANKIKKLAPKGLNKSYFVSGGSEATESAIKLARQYHVETGNKDKHKVIFRDISYHGNTLGVLALSGTPKRKEFYKPMLKEYPSVPAPYCYNCKSNKNCKLECAWSLEDIILKEGHKTVSAFITEPISGSSGGAITPPEGYFQTIRKICDNYNVLLIADEIMTGVGRTGKNFGMDHWNVKADMMALAKGLSGGYVPLGALVASEKIYNVIKNGSGAFVHGHTYGGNPFACAVGNAVLGYIMKHKLIKRVSKIGDYLKEKLEKLKENHPLISDVRGKGLMLGMEFEKNVGNLVKDSAFQNGLIVYAAGTMNDLVGESILVAPPFIIKKKECDKIVEILDKTISQIEKVI